MTLVLQALTLPSLIRALDLAGTTATECEADEARRLVLEAALKDDLERLYRHRLACLKRVPGDPDGQTPEQYARYLDVSRDLLNARVKVPGLGAAGSRRHRCEISKREFSRRLAF